MLVVLTRVEEKASALYSYDVVVELEKLGLSRRLYENALLHYKRLEPAQ